VGFRRCAQPVPTPGFHGVRPFRLNEPTSIADRRYSYQTSPHLEIPLEDGEALVLPLHFDHPISKPRWTPYFNDGFRRKQSHHPGFFSSV
jgi:hypothetical protein